MTPLDRRAFLRRAAGAAGLAAVPVSLSGLVAACTETRAGDGDGGSEPRIRRAGLGDGGYGELIRETGVMRLPRDFRLRSFGAIGDPMSDGNPTPIALDGMAAFAAGGGAVGS